MEPAGFGEVQGRPSRPAAATAIKAHQAALTGRPLRAAISEALANEPKLGGKERRFAAWAARELSRHQRFVDLLAKTHGHAPSGFSLEGDLAILRYTLWRRHLTHASAERTLFEVALPGPLRPRSIPDALLAKVCEVLEPPLPPDPLERSATIHSFPNWLAQAIARSAPEGEVDAVLAALNRDPVIWLRARPPGTREEILGKLRAEGIEVEGGPADDSIRLTDDGRAIFESKPMKSRRLQVMDLGSQLLANLCTPRVGATVIDWCAGAGGKSFALADLVGPTGKVLATDLKRSRLEEARRRGRELSIRNVSFPDNVRLAEADVVLIDAPCSGSGTLGREPDQKWKLQWKKVEELVATQKKILDEVVAGVRDNCVIVYGTCSVLNEENEAVIDAFLKKHPTWQLDGAPLRVWPHKIDGGGFFGARLTKRQ
jgi:16S rRNA (cytosine967-C5)-methyltransferase